jgi:hypothetical protein
VGQEISSFPPFIIDKLRFAMSDDSDNQSRLHFDMMDEAFCDRMLAAIKAGLESAPIGVITTPGTRNPKYVSAEPYLPLASALVDMDL